MKRPSISVLLTALLILSSLGTAVAGNRYLHDKTHRDVNVEITRGDGEDRRIMRINEEPAPLGPWLGALIAATEDGLKVQGVAQGSPAARAGLQVGDLITSIDQRDLTGDNDQKDVLEGFEIGERVRLTVDRDGRSERLRAELGAHPGSVEFELAEDYHGGAVFHRLGGDHSKMNLMFGKRGKPRLGVALGSLTDQLGEYFGTDDGNGILVNKVIADTPAERAGLKAGDVITRIDDTDISSAGDIHRAMQDVRSGESMQVEVIRRGVREIFTAVLDSDPPEKIERHGSLFHGLGDEGANVFVRRVAGDDMVVDVDIDVDDALAGAEDIIMAVGKADARWVDDDGNVHDLLGKDFVFNSEDGPHALFIKADGDSAGNGKECRKMIVKTLAAGDGEGVDLNSLGIDFDQLIAEAREAGGDAVVDKKIIVMRDGEATEISEEELHDLLAEIGDDGDVQVRKEIRVIRGDQPGGVAVAPGVHAIHGFHSKKLQAL